jgi:hypothetical protein
MQVVIASVTGCILLWRHAFDLAAIFLVTMEISAVVGAAWGGRLQNKFRRGSGEVAAR